MEFIRRLNQIRDREAKCVEGTCLFWAGQFSYRPTPLLPIGCLHKFFSRSGWKAAGIIKPSAIPGQILLWIWLKMVGNGQSSLLPQIYVFLKPSVGFTVILTLWWYSCTVCSDTRHQIWSIHFPASRYTSTRQWCPKKPLFNRDLPFLWKREQGSLSSIIYAWMAK